MSTHNICFRREIRKILCGYSLLSVDIGHGGHLVNDAEPSEQLETDNTPSTEGPM